jgi:hypothetical protein
MAAPISDMTIEAAAEFERAIAAAGRAGPSPNVHPRVHEAMIEAMRSELACCASSSAIRNAPAAGTREPVPGNRYPGRRPEPRSA